MKHKEAENFKCQIYSVWMNRRTGNYNPALTSRFPYNITFGIL